MENFKYRQFDPATGEGTQEELPIPKKLIDLFSKYKDGEIFISAPLINLKNETVDFNIMTKHNGGWTPTHKITIERI